MTETVTEASVILTDAAQTKVAQLLAAEEMDLALRVAVQPGGCSGLRYQLYFDDQSYGGDVVTAFGDVRVVIDEKSAPYLAGATIDFADTISKQGFTIDNPNATGTCACGDSFH
ncbi:MAG: iron-sulfur cluster assembly accessory protein [Propionibacteriaceae bacterium]|jgi:iron-sulfur cluster assembly accessory protein|nr:iron-sulfur cluster assembly accessory protein [Propionibacteriaceae bacterium]